MNYQSLSQLELIRVLEAHEQMRISLQARVDTLEDNARLVANLQLHRLELEAQNRTLREAQGQLEESRSRYADLYDFAPIAYCTFDRNGIVLEINLRGASLLGHERGQIVGKPLLSMLKVRDPLEFSRFLRHSIASDVPVTGELHVIDTRGEVALQLLGAAPLSAPGTCRAALIDVTAEREAERASEVHHRAEKALRMRIEAIDGASAAVNRALITCEGGDIRAFLQVVADEARALTQAEYAALGIGGSDGGVFEPWVYSGTAPHHAALSESPPHATGLLAVPRMRHPVQFRDTRAAGTPPVIDTHRLTSFVSVPILCGDARQGSIYLANKLDGSAFSDDDQVLIEMLAERVGSAMEVAQLRREELRAHLRLELLARAGPLLAESIDLEATLAAIAKLLVPLAADMSALDLLEADGSTRRLAVYHPDPAQNKVFERMLGSCPLALQPSAVRHALASALPERQNLQGLALDAAVPMASQREILRQLHVSSTLLCPLMLRGRAIGVLHLMNSDRARVFGDEDTTLAQAIAHHAALVIEGTRLYSVAQSAIRTRDSTLAVVSHDLRNYLSTVRVGAELLTMGDGSAAGTVASQRQIAAIQRAVSGMNLLIDDLRDAAVLESGAFTIHVKRDSVARLFDDAEQLFAHQAASCGVRLRVSCDAHLPELLFDRARILQVLANLIGNALKSMARGGALTLSAARAPDAVEIAVADDGVGIPAAELSNIFKRNWASGARAGSGLGLFIAKGLVEAHGGTIRVESTPGAGSVFRVVLPAPAGRP